MSLSSQLRATARSLRAQADLLEAEALDLERGPTAPAHYTSKTWPGGARNFRRLVASGALPATKLGRDLLVRREDGDEVLATKRRAPRPSTRAIDDDESDDAIAARLRSVGVRVARGANG